MRPAPHPCNARGIQNCKIRFDNIPESEIENRKSLHAFSLIEVVLALGILTFALVALLSLFPLALGTAADSKTETRITQIAQSIFADIRQSSNLSSTQLVIGPDPGTNSSDLTTQDLGSSSGSTVITYNEEGEPVTASGNYTGGYPSAVFIARVTADPVTGTTPTLSKIFVSIEYPAAAAESERKKYNFVTMKGDL